MQLLGPIDSTISFLPSSLALSVLTNSSYSVICLSPNDVQWYPEWAFSEHITALFRALTWYSRHDLKLRKQQRIGKFPSMPHCLPTAYVSGTVSILFLWDVPYWMLIIFLTHPGYSFLQTQRKLSFQRPHTGSSLPALNQEPSIQVSCILETVYIMCSALISNMGILTASDIVQSCILSWLSTFCPWFVLVWMIVVWCLSR